MSDFLSSIRQQLKDQKDLPPVHLWEPEFCGDIDIRIASNGDWFHNGGKIHRQGLVNLLASVLRKDDDEYFLVTPVEKMRIQVDDLPLQIIDFTLLNDAHHQQQIIVTTNTDRQFSVNQAQSIEVTVDNSNQPVPVVHLPNGIDGKIQRAVFYRLVDVAVEREGQLMVSSEQQWFSLGDIN